MLFRNLHTGQVVRLIKEVRNGFLIEKMDFNYRSGYHSSTEIVGFFEWGTDYVEALNDDDIESEIEFAQQLGEYYADCPECSLSLYL